VLQLDEIKQKLAEIKAQAKEAETALGVSALEKELAELRASMEAPDFWMNIEAAGKVSKKAKPIEDKLEQFKKLQARLEDAEVMIDLLEEEYDEDTAEEFAKEIAQLKKDTSELRLKALLRGPYDANGAILSLHAGAGGTEAQDWVEMLYRMYTRWCERHRYAVRVLDLLPGEEAGVKSVTFEVEGLNAYGYLKAEKGVHRLVRISPFDASARRHTSFASLDVMPDIEEDDSDIEILPDDIRVDTYRSSGAGGQHVNKTESAIRITHLSSGFVVQCQNERSQIQNRETAMRMLRAKLIEKRENERMQEVADIKGEMKKIEWGSQIRSYVFHPYSMVKDHRTGAETGNVAAVMDGEIDMFINAYLSEF
jgi:peptide chain release factor 2